MGWNKRINHLTLLSLSLLQCVLVTMIKFLLWIFIIENIDLFIPLVELNLCCKQALFATLCTRGKLLVFIYTTSGIDDLYKECSWFFKILFQDEMHMFISFKVSRNQSGPFCDRYFCDKSFYTVHFCKGHL